MNNFSVLIDTNIIIPLEDTSRSLDPRLAEIRRVCSENNVILKIHPRQKDDLLRDKDESRREIVMSRIEQYVKIENPPVWRNDELKELGIAQANENDEIDNILLCALYRNAVHVLITEDRKIHKKAEKLESTERVYYIDQFLGFLDRKFGREASVPPWGIQEIYLHQLDKNYDFFNSLREGYDGFNTWLDRVSQEGRKAWIVGDCNSLLAIVIRKEENNPVINTENRALRGKALKLCTFKVSPRWRGRKIGERLLYTAFRYAVEQKIEWIYLTAFGEEQQMLVSLCEEFGFENMGTDLKGRDNVYVKDMRKPNNVGNINNLEYAIKHYPFYKTENCDKWIIPIQPHWHNQLFPDLREIDFFTGLPESYSSSANTIKKAYLCHANARGIKIGDIVYFYRSDDRRSIECVGIVEKVFRSSNAPVIIAEVSKRTVYSDREIEEMANKETLVILFRLLEYIDPISSSKLTELGVTGKIQSIRGINFSL